MPHGYGWLGGEGCVRGSPEGTNNLNNLATIITTKKSFILMEVFYSWR